MRNFIRINNTAMGNEVSTLLDGNLIVNERYNDRDTGPPAGSINLPHFKP